MVLFTICNIGSYAKACYRSELGPDSSAHSYPSPRARINACIYAGIRDGTE